MLRTFQVYAGLTFLSYEYAEDEAQVQFNTRKKFGSPKQWGVSDYKVKKILWDD